MQETFQPGDGFGVQVVGRLVQQQHVRAREQQTAQCDTAALTPGQHADIGIPRRQAQCFGGHFQLALEVVGVRGLDQVFQLGLTRGEGVEIGVRLGVGGIDFIKFGLGVLDVSQGFFHALAHVLGIIQFRLLGKVADIQTRHGTCFAVVVLIDAGHDAQQRGLARAVETEHTDLGTREEGQRDVLENLALRGNDLAHPVHGIDVLRHGIPIWLENGMTRR